MASQCNSPYNLVVTFTPKQRCKGPQQKETASLRTLPGWRFPLVYKIFHIMKTTEPNDGLVTFAPNKKELPPALWLEISFGVQNVNFTS